MADTTTRYTIPAILQAARDQRHPLTPAEGRVWKRARNRGLGFKIRRQHPIWRFIADFYCAQARLVIEIDGDSHQAADQKEYDLARTLWLEERGYKVIRFENNEVQAFLDNVLEEIAAACNARISPSSPTLLPLGEGSAQLGGSHEHHS